MLSDRLDYLQAQLQQAKTDIEEIVAWSERIEKHSQEMNNTLLDLFEMIRNSEILRGILEEPSRTTAKQAAKKKR